MSPILFEKVVCNSRTLSLAGFSKLSFYVACLLTCVVVVCANGCVTAQNDPNLAIGASTKPAADMYEVLKNDPCLVFLSFDKSEFSSEVDDTRVSLRTYPKGRMVKQEKFEWEIKSDEPSSEFPSKEKGKLKHFRVFRIPKNQIWVVDKVTIGKRTQDFQTNVQIECTNKQEGKNFILIEAKAASENLLELGKPLEILKLPDAVDRKVAITYYSGALSKYEIDDVIKSSLRSVGSCYDKKLPADDEKDQISFFRIKVMFVIVADGSVQSADTENMSHSQSGFLKPEEFQKLYPQWKPVEECILEVVKQMKFPQPRGGGVVNVRYPFHFRERKKESQLLK